MISDNLACADIGVKFGQPMERRFNPYQDNGGTVLGVAGEDFVVAVADTRLSVGYSIHTRNHSKITRLTDTCVIATSGMQADINSLHKLLKIRVAQYVNQHRRQPGCGAVAQLLSTVLYSRRFFPFYTFNVLCGIDSDGKGAVYGYDAIGSFKRDNYNCAGSGGSLAMPILDNQISGNNQTIPRPTLSRDQIVELAVGCLTSVSERDIYTGDQAEVFVITREGITSFLASLRND